LSRIAPVAPGSDPAAAVVEARLLAARGQVSHLYQVLLNSIPVADGWEYFLTIVRQRLSLPARYRELAILHIAVLNRAGYEFDSHVSHGLQAGLENADIEALRNGDAAHFRGEDALVLAYTDAITRDVQVPSETYQAVAATWPPDQIVELTVTIAAYNMVSRVLGALEIHG
jgi:4-carboxymuconolactone decarboxylase